MAGFCFTCAETPAFFFFSRGRLLSTPFTFGPFFVFDSCLGLLLVGDRYGRACHFGKCARSNCQYGLSAWGQQRRLLADQIWGRFESDGSSDFRVRPLVCGHVRLAQLQGVLQGCATNRLTTGPWRHHRGRVSSEWWNVELHAIICTVLFLVLKGRSLIGRWLARVVSDGGPGACLCGKRSEVDFVQMGMGHFMLAQRV